MSYREKGVDGTFEDYIEMIVQFGFVTLFAVAMPLAPLVAIAHNFLEIQVDKFKIVDLVRRPLP